MRRPTMLLALAVWVAAGSSPAHAERYAAAADDPREPAVPAAGDIQHVSGEFDSDLGTWSVTVRFSASRRGAPEALLRTFLRLSDESGACLALPSAELIALARPFAPSRDVGRLLPDGTGTRWEGWSGSAAYSLDRRELTLWMDDAALKGRRPCGIERTALTVARSGRPLDDVPWMDLGPVTAAADVVRPTAGLWNADRGVWLLPDGRRVRGVRVGAASEPVDVHVELLSAHSAQLADRRLRLLPGAPARRIDLPVTRAVAVGLRTRRLRATRLRMHLTDAAGNRSVVEQPVRREPAGETGGGPNLLARARTQPRWARLR